MNQLNVNYDLIAPTYDRRYEGGTGLKEVAPALLSLAESIGAKCILEAGCGTGNWVAEMRDGGRHAFGVDRSFGMLQQAMEQRGPLRIVCGDACRLPFHDASFDFIYSMNAFHHFHDQPAFVSEASRLLKQEGILAILGMDPRECRWYLYDYFESTYEADLERFPATETLIEWMKAAGFDDIKWNVVERVEDDRCGREVLNDPFLGKNSTSQLILLTEAAYAAGMHRIEDAIARGSADGQDPVFPVDVSITMVRGRRIALL